MEEAATQARFEGAMRVARAALANFVDGSEGDAEGVREAAKRLLRATAEFIGSDGPVEEAEMNAFYRAEEARELARNTGGESPLHSTYCPDCGAMWMGTDDDEGYALCRECLMHHVRRAEELRGEEIAPEQFSAMVWGG